MCFVDKPLEGELLDLLFLKALQDVAVGLEVGRGLHHEEGVGGLRSGHRVAAVSGEAEEHLALLQVLHGAVRHRRKKEGLKVVLGQADQGAVQQPLGILPTDKLQKRERNTKK